MTPTRRQHLPVTLALLGGVAGCGTESWPTAAAGPQATRIAGLWWPFLIITFGVWVVALTMLVLAVVRARRRTEPAVDEQTTRTQRNAVVAAVAVTITILLALAVSDFRVVRGMDAFATAEPALTIQLAGHRWWWEVTYEDSVPARRLTTANEIRIPVGRPVLLKVTSRDVIHSFWVPLLHGKHDLIPGYTSSFWIQADRPGVYEGRCAEYCGHQHANMRLEIVAESEERFLAWYEAQLQPAGEPSDSLASRGQAVFLNGPCVMCHTIRGTPAGSRLGPDLTHLASRRTIAAGTLPNTREHLADWVTNAQSVKPGNRMPPIPLSSPDLDALLRYLEGLR